MHENGLWTHDYHVHTHHSVCAAREMTPAAILAEAQTLGRRVIGFADHVTCAKQLDRLRALRRELTALDHHGIRCFVGCETELCAPGRPALGPEIRRHADFVFLAANHYQSVTVEPPASFSPEGIAKHVTAMFCGACAVPYVDVIAHPLNLVGLMRYNMADPWQPPDASLLFSSLDLRDFKDALALARRNEIAVELSRKSLNPEIRKGMIEFYALCKDAGIKFAVGSDAHCSDQMASLETMQPLVDALGLIPADMWRPDHTVRKKHTRVRIRQSRSGKPAVRCRLQLVIQDSVTQADKPARIVLRGRDLDKIIWSEGRETLTLPSGTYELEVSCGFAYEKKRFAVTLKRGQDAEAVVRLKRRIDLPALGWVGGENHCHVIHTRRLAREGLDLAYAAKVGRAEGLDYMQVCPLWDASGVFYSAKALNQRCRKLSDQSFHLSWNLEAPKTYFGEDHGGRKGNLHCYGHGWTIGMKDHGGDHGFFKTPPNFVVHDYIHQQGGVVAYAHPARDFMINGNFVSNAANELILDTVIGPTYDGIDILNDEPPLFFLSEKIWHAVLNQGYCMAGTAASDTCLERPRACPGALRLYTHIHGRFSLKRIARAIKQGRNLVTTGPLVFFDIDGTAPGDCLAADGKARALHIEAYGGPGEGEFLESVQVIRNGETVHVWDLRRRRCQHWKGSLTISETDDAWYIVKVLARDMDSDHQQQWGEGAKHHAIVNPIYFRTPAFRKPRPPKTQVALQIANAKTSRTLAGTVTVRRRGRVLQTLRVPASHDALEFSMPPDAVLEIRARRQTKRLTILDDQGVFEFVRDIDSCHPTFYTQNSFLRARALAAAVQLKALFAS